MPIILNKILKFLLGFSLAILLSGFVYNYFPDLWKMAKESGFFVASLVDSQNQVNQDKIIEVPDTSIALQEVLQENTEAIVELDSEENWGWASTETSEQDKLDDLSDQIDILRRQVNDLLEAKKQSSFAKALEDKKRDEINDKEKVDEEEKDLQDEADKEDKQVDVEMAEIDKNKTNYLQILISEVQIAGENDDKQEFVELYNPNDVNIDLSNWYLQRKTKTADNFTTYVSSNLFLNKIIYAKSYFLIARQGSFFSGFADILTENPLTEDNTLVLKNPNKENSDLLGFGDAGEFLGNTALNPINGKTIGRKWLDSEKLEQNIGANHIDFEMQVSTPKSQNIKYIEPAIITGGGGNGGGGGESSVETIYDEILISEILLGDNEFIELYNPNNVDVSLSNWYLQRKTKTAENYSSYVTKTDFLGKNILANDYFLIVRQGSEYEALADIIFDEPLTVDNSLVLKNPEQEISDKLGFGEASDFETLSALSTQSEKSLGRKFINNSQQDTDNNFNDFEIQVSTPKAQNITFVEPLIVEIPKDITPPEVEFGLLSSVQTSLSFSINLQISDLLGTVTPSGVNSFIFRWKEIDGDWQEDAEENFTVNPVIRDFTGEDQKTYYFQVKAKDNENNWSEFLPTEPIFTKIELPLPPPLPPELLPIVINEIQIEGDEKSHDFIEIYNPNDEEIMLDEYRLVKRAKSSSSDTTIKSWGAEDKILAKQYYLWASSTDENYPALVGADISTKQNISDNNGVAIRKGLEDTGEIIDAVGWGEFNNVLFEGSVFTANPEKNKSISRIQGIDTNDNSKDFIILDTPTPKAE